MGKIKNFFRRNGVSKRVFSLALVVAMVVTLFTDVPGGILNAKAAEGEQNVKLYIYIPNEWNWTTPALWYSGGSSSTVTSDGTTDVTGASVPGWGASDVGYAMTKDGDSEWYYIYIKGDFSNIQFMDLASPSTGLVSNAYSSFMKQYTGDDAQSLYYKCADSTWNWYKDSTCTELLVGTTSTFLLVGDLPGIAWDQTATPNFVQDTTDTNKYSVTLSNVSAGSYNYKVLQDSETYGWGKEWGDGNNRTYSLSAPANLTFTIDSTDQTKGVTVTPSYIKDLVVSAASEIEKGTSITLPSTGTYYPGNGNSEEVSVSYSVSAATGLTLTGNTLEVANNYTGSEVEVTASYGDVTKTITISVVEQMYSFTINYYNPNVEDVDVNGPDLWIWENGGSGGNVGYGFTGTLDDTENGITWLTTTISVPYNKLGIIARLENGTWDGGKDNNRYFELTSGTSATLWYEFGQDITTEKPVIEETEQRYMVLEYERADGNYTGWGLYTWNSGLGSAVTIDFQVVDGKGIAKVPIANSVSSLSFCIKQTVGTAEWANKDGGDHAVATPLDQTVIKAKMTQGSEPELQYPYNTGYELDPVNNCVRFFYRDDEKYLDGTLASLGSVKVEVDGRTYDMTYDAANQRYVYELEGLVQGEHTYRYSVNGTYVLDKFNENATTVSGQDYSVYEYYKYQVEIKADLQMASMNYTQNNVLSLTIEGVDAKAIDVKEAYVDASSLGLSSKYAIDTKILAVALSAIRNTAAGTKTLPITVVDQYGNNYTTSVNVTVTDADSDEDDFDWDEAVIYFMVTDRFFDGNTSNNTANGEDTYGTNAGLYHGGDFAGVTAKLDYLKDLGVNTIWITPIVDNIDGVTVTDEGADDVPYNASYHGYWAQDFTSLDPTLGTAAEFETLIKEAHNRDMKIMVDVVLNHAGYGMEKSDAYSAMIRDSVTSGNYLLGDGQSGLPDFVTEDPAVRQLLIQWQVAWMTNYDIDYFRVDTVKHVDNTTWTAFKNALTEENPEFKMIGEYYGAGYASTFDNLGTGTMDSLLDFDFKTMASDFVGGKIDSVESYFESRNAAINNTAMMGGFLSSHDEDGFLYKLEQTYDEETAYAKAMVAASLQLTAKGQPVIYYGEELGQSGANNYPYQTNRYDYDWSIANDENTMLTHYKKMLSIRNAYTDVFAKGTRTKLAGSDAEQYLAFERTYDSESVVTVLNITNAEKTVSFKTNYTAGMILKDLYNDTTYTVADDQTVSITVPAAKDGGTVVLVETDIQEDDTDEDDDYRLVIPVTDDFSEVIETAGKVSDGTTITVLLSDDSVTMPATVFEAIKGRNINLVVQANDKALWTINGKNITDQFKDGVCLGVTVDSNAIPEEKVKALAGSRQTKQFSLEHDGAFGFTADLTLNIGTEHSGKYANLFYHNEKTGKLEYQGVDVVDKDGNVVFTFTHASDYVIVFADADMKPIENNSDGNITASVSTTQTNNTTTGNTTATNAAGVNTGDDFNAAPTILLLCMGVMIVVYALRKKNYIH